MDSDLVNKFRDAVKELNDEMMCSICLSQYTDPSVVHPCGHVFCGQCIGDLMHSVHKECPNCRTHIEGSHEIKEMATIAQKVKNVLRAL